MNTFGPVVAGFSFTQGKPLKVKFCGDCYVWLFCGKVTLKYRVMVTWKYPGGMPAVVLSNLRTDADWISRIPEEARETAQEFYNHAQVMNAL